MGVKGLWRLLLPIGRRISIETLEGQILAIDASIWMTQFLKAMRDPDSGAVRPAAHIIGFFRRLCKLRFHGIRPVFVFDGATPEIKRRELRARRRRRDQFVAQHGAAAVQRMAKRLLVEQLQKSKAKLLVGNNKNVKIKAAQLKDDGGGAFAAGFYLPQDDNKEKKKQGVIAVDDDNDNDAQFEWKEGEYRITEGAASKKPAATSTETAIAVDDNDWDKPIEVDDSDEEDQKDDSEDEVVEYDDVLWTSRKKRKHHKTKEKDDFLDEDYILQLPQVDRKEAIEAAKKKQRMLSRQEFMPVAAHADQYSQAQVRNFLRSSKLNRDIVQMAKKAVHQDNSNQEGTIMASDRTRRVVFEKDIDESKEQSSSSEEEEGEEFLKTNQRPTAARRRQSKQSPSEQREESQSTEETRRSHRIRKIGYLKEVSSEDEEDGAGFFTSSTATAETGGGATSKQRAILDDDDQNAGCGGGGFMPSGEAVGGFIAVNTNAAAEVGGGFQTKKDFPSNACKDSSEKSTKKNVQFSNDATNGVATGGTEAITKVVAFQPGGFLSKNADEPGNDHESPKVAGKKTSSKGAHFWRGTSDDEDSDNERGSLLGPSATARRDASKVVKRLMQTRRGGAAMPYAVLQANSDDNEGDDDSSEDGGGFVKAQPKALLKSTGLDEDSDDDEVIVIEDNRTETYSGVSSDARTAQELQDAMLAKALQEEEDANLAASYADSSLPGFANGSGHPERRPAGSSDEDKDAKGVKWGHNIGFERPSRRLTTEVFVRSLPKDPPAADKASAPAMGLMVAGDDDSEEGVDWENGDDEAGSTRGGDNPDTSASPTKGPIESVDKSEGGEADAGRVNADGQAKVDPPPILVQAKDQSASEPLIIGVADSDSDNDEVDWEDGDANVDDVANLSSQAVATEVVATNANATITETGAGVESDRQLQRQQPTSETRATSEEALPRQNSTASTDDEPFARQQSSSSDASDGAFAADDDEDMPARFEESAVDFGDSDAGIDDFGRPHTGDNAAALHQAETTAANLTNWAGRAVRRAVAEHLGEAAPTSQPETSESPVREDDSDVEVVEEAKGSAEASNEGHDLALNEENAEEAAKMLEEYESELAEVAKNSIERETDTMTDEMQEEIMHLLQLFGVPYVQAPAEAEAQCVALEQLGLVNGIVTEDSDVFVFGGKTVYKNIFDDQKYVEVYRTDDAEREMGLGPNQMVALAMLLGGDYTEGVKGVGIVNGMEIVSSFDVSVDLKQGLQKFRTWLDGFEPVVEAKARKDGGKGLTREQVFHIKHRTARNRWNPPESFPSDNVITAYVNPVVDKSTTKFSFGVPDTENIVAFCNKNAGWVPEDTRRLLEPVVDRVENKRSHQTRIDQFMQYEHGIKFANVRSKRLRHILAGAQEEETIDDVAGLDKPPSRRRVKKRKYSPKAGASQSAGVVGPARAPDVAFDSRTTDRALEPRVASRATFDFSAAGAASSQRNAAATPTPNETNETLVSVLASDAFTTSETVQPSDVSRAGTSKSKAKTKSLTSYLGQVKPAEEKQAPKVYTEEYRAQLNKVSVPTNRAPPVYSKHSELATTLRQKSAKAAPPTAAREKEDDA